MAQLTHFDDHGGSRMVNVGDKPASARFARASGQIRMQAATLQRIQASDVSKGNVLEVARIAAIMAAKRTGELIPLCHPLGLDGVEVAFRVISEGTLEIEATAKITAKTGVEMEALVAVSTAALTIYDMCKSIDRSMVIDRVQLEEKRGGKSGTYLREISTDDAE